MADLTTTEMGELADEMWALLADGRDELDIGDASRLLERAGYTGRELAEAWDCLIHLWFGDVGASQEPSCAR
jgi:hypothetical protein